MTPLLDIGAADSLRHERAALLETIEEMQTKSGPLLTARYQAMLGRLELQLLELQIEIQVTRCRIESLQSRINLGQPVTTACLAEINTRIELELADSRRQLETQEQAWINAREFLGGTRFIRRNAPLCFPRSASAADKRYSLT